MIIEITPTQVEGSDELANKLLIEAHNHTKTEDRVTVYYDLRNSLETSTLIDSRTQEVITLPYKTLKSDRIVVQGADFKALELDENSIVPYVLNLLNLELLTQ